MTKYLNTKPGSIEEVAANLSKFQSEGDYQKMFKKELEKAGKGIGAMSPKEKKDFFNKIDSKYKAKEETKEVKESVEETHSFMTEKMNQSQKDAPGEKEPVKMKEADQHADEINDKKVKASMTKGEKEIPALPKAESINDSIKSVWQLSAEELEKIKSEAKYMKANRLKQYGERADKDEEDEKKKEKLMADTGSKKTEIDVEPKVDYKN